MKPRLQITELKCMNIKEENSSGAAKSEWRKLLRENHIHQAYHLSMDPFRQNHNRHKTFSS